MNIPSISIIIPTYNDWARLSLCITALTNQSCPQEDFEIIVVNNNPTDNIPKDFFIPRNCTVINEIKPGSYSARNAALQIVKGSIIGFTDSDCIPDKEWIANAMVFFNNDPYSEIGIVTGRIKLFYVNPAKLTAAEVFEKYTAFPTEAYSKNGHCVTANWFSYKKVLDKYGPFNAELKSGGDMELSGIISKNHKIVYSEAVLVNHPARYSSNEITQKMTRVLGGIYEKKYKRKAVPFVKWVIMSAYYRWKSIIKFFFKRPLSDSLKILYIHNCIIAGSIKESYNLIIKKQDTKR